MNTPSVSVIIPCRNEAGFIAACVESIVANGFPHDELEVLVADGMSTDGTRLALGDLAARYPFMRVVDNPAGATPVGLNLAIRAAQGTMIVRIDAHSTILPGYLMKCVSALRAGQGRRCRRCDANGSADPSLFGQAVVACLSHSFGVGGSRFRTGASEACFVDTVFNGCYRKSLFEEIGYFNEQLPRGQDMEFSQRVKSRGGRILLLPDAVSVYHARSSLKSFLRHNWTNGVWAVLPFLYSDVAPVSIRHLVPLIFSIALTGALALWIAAPPVGIWAAVAVTGPYAALCTISAIHLAWAQRQPLLALPAPFVFLSLHLGYGFGSCWGCLQALGISAGRLISAHDPGSIRPTENRRIP